MILQMLESNRCQNMIKWHRKLLHWKYVCFIVIYFLAGNCIGSKGVKLLLKANFSQINKLHMGTNIKICKAAVSYSPKEPTISQNQNTTIFPI